MERKVVNGKGKRLTENDIKDRGIKEKLFFYSFSY